MAKKCGFVALAGRPNAGKSTFLNYVLGEKVSIVSDKPQTTRNRILGVYHGPDLQIGFLDLPGIHKPKFKMNKMMMRSVNQGIADADLVLHFLDMSVPSGPGERFVTDFLAKRECVVFLVLNKMDLVNKNKAIARITALYEQMKPREVIPISSVSGENIPRLMDLIAKNLPENDFLFGDDMLTDQPLRFMAAEQIREIVLRLTRDELPHATNVTVDTFSQDREAGLFQLGATVWIERKSQRRILIGSGGKMVQNITRNARRSLRKLLGAPVQLDLIIKVADGWRSSDKWLEDFKLQDTP